jgi:hypothetical protein
MVKADDGTDLTIVMRPFYLEPATADVPDPGLTAALAETK